MYRALVHAERAAGAGRRLRVLGGPKSEAKERRKMRREAEGGGGEARREVFAKALADSGCALPPPEDEAAWELLMGS